MLPPLSHFCVRRCYPTLSYPITGTTGPRSWRNLCASRWRLRPQERHAEVWRADKAAGEARPLVWPAAPPPTWRQIYGRLHQENRVPNGALSSSHMVIGKTCQEVGFCYENVFVFFF